jgi:hypothetical protein
MFLFWRNHHHRHGMRGPSSEPENKEISLVGIRRERQSESIENHKSKQLIFSSGHSFSFHALPEILIKFHVLKHFRM